LTAVFPWRRLKFVAVVVTVLTVLLGLEPARVFQAVSAFNDFTSESDSSGDETQDEEGAGVQACATLRRKAAAIPVGRSSHRMVLSHHRDPYNARTLHSASCASPSGLGFTLRC
jgi:hypothetical protein